MAVLLPLPSDCAADVRDLSLVVDDLEICLSNLSYRFTMPLYD